MIIDFILDRYHDEKTFDQFGKYPVSFAGESCEYNPRRFYYDVLQYGEIGDDITRAMDGGTENDVKQALCNYIIRNKYNPNICGFVCSVNWLENSRVKDCFGNPRKISEIVFGRECASWAS